ncbi:MAG: peptidoglycan/LPS O-acetylase OafA/YrhL [Vicingaceae bacterium]
MLLALSVVLSHSSSILGIDLVGGRVAVQAFYIISGFYMTLILKEKYIGKNGSYGLFISNRLLRLFPVYWSVLLLTLLVAFFLPASSKDSMYGFLNYYSEFGKDLDFSTAAFLFFTNTFLIFQDLVMYLGVDLISGELFFTSNFRETSPELYHFLLVPQAWTIGIEITFYLIAPFLVVRKLKYVLLFIVGSILLRLVLMRAGLSSDPWSYRFFPTELVFFLLGTVGYFIYKKIAVFRIKKTYLYLVFLSILAFTFSYNYLNIPFKVFLYPMLFFTAVPFIFVLSKKWKVDRWIGELSYPVYISHILVLMIIEGYDISIMSNKGITLTILTLVLSVFLNELIAKRVEVIRQRRVQ